MQKWWAVLFGAVNLAALVLFVVSPAFGWWLPKDVSAPGFGSRVDFLYYMILAVTAFFFVLTEVLLVWVMWRYAHQQPGQRAWYTHGNHTLEWAWTLVPAGILLFIAFAQVRAWEHIKYQSHFPEPDQLVEVSARQFEWRMRYAAPDTSTPVVIDAHAPEAEREEVHQRARVWEDRGAIDDVHLVNELHTWKGAKVRVALKTRDVIHSFFLPNLRLKQDALPGKTIPVWFEAVQSNVEWNEQNQNWSGPDGKPVEEWELACAELCGWGHYRMQGRFYVHKDHDDYLRWLRQAAQQQNQRAAPEATK